MNSEMRSLVILMLTLLLLGIVLGCIGGYGAGQADGIRYATQHGLESRFATDFPGFSVQVRTESEDAK